MNKMLLGTLALMPLLASAATPSFDCAKAHGTTEQLICQDAGLAALDNQLATLYPTVSYTHLTLPTIYSV